MNIKVKLAYDGTNYHGWQFQNNVVTVQGIVQQACGNIMRDVETVHGCSRTDAGVHAIEYVCNFHSQTNIPMENMPLALNTHLPSDVRALKAEVAEDDFHARFSAKSKTYIYKIDNSRIASPFFSRYAFHFPFYLDALKMREGAKYMLGEHDFSCFMASGATQSSPIRNIYSLEVNREDNFITIKITANSYLYNMVRIIAGTLIHCGCGKMPPQSVADIIDSKDRTLAGITAPPHGLYLLEVQY